MKSYQFINRLHKQREIILEFCEKHENIFLYGKGFISSSFYRYLTDEGIPVKAFLVSKKKEGENLWNGLPVLQVDRANISPNDGIILSVSSVHHKEIEVTLKKAGIDRKRNILAQDILDSLMGESDADAYYGVDEDGVYFMQNSELDSIGKRLGTDKSSEKHNYLRKYEFFLSKYKEEVFNLIELGIYKGKSLEMWREYFKNANVIGVDIDDNCREFEDKGVKVEICDLSDMENVVNLGEKYKPKIVIDDASHVWSHQIKSFMGLFPYIQNGGLFIMEDIGTSFRRYRNSQYSDSLISGYDFLSALAEIVSGKELNMNDRVKNIFGDDIISVSNEIDMISFIYGSAIVIKK